MASARRIAPPTPPPPPGTVVLTMSDAEARTLLAVLRHVGGCPDSSPRKHATAVLCTLYDALDVEPFGAPGVREAELAGGSITFADYA